MARLLRDKDYLRLIQDDNLLQIIESNQSIKLDVEQSAQAEMISYLAQRYITSEVFSHTSQYSNTVAYKAKNLVEYTEPAFNPNTSYSVDDLVSYKDKIYKCLVAGIGVPPTIETQWEYVQEDKMLYYLTLPNPEYSASATYSPGNQVWYNDIVYTCLAACTNILPTVTSYWSAGSTYTVNNVKPTDNTKWTAGDNRNQQIVLYLIDITLYHLHSRINPRNIPDLRKERYDGNSQMQTGGAIAWLKRVASGDITADLPQISPQQGLSIRWGSVEKTDTYF
jgi:hypothetical protein